MKSNATYKLWFGVFFAIFVTYYFYSVKQEELVVERKEAQLEKERLQHEIDMSILQPIVVTAKRRVYKGPTKPKGKHKRTMDEWWDRMFTSHETARPDGSRDELKLLMMVRECAKDGHKSCKERLVRLEKKWQEPMCKSFGEKLGFYLGSDDPQEGFPSKEDFSEGYVYLQTEPIFDEKYFDEIRLETEEQSDIQYISVKLKDTGQRYLAYVTRNNIGKRACFVVGNRIITCPSIVTKIDRPSMRLTIGGSGGKYAAERVFNGLCSDPMNRKLPY